MNIHNDLFIYDIGGKHWVEVRANEWDQLPDDKRGIIDIPVDTKNEERRKIPVYGKMLDCEGTMGILVKVN